MYVLLYTMTVHFRHTDSCFLSLRKILHCNKKINCNGLYHEECLVNFFKSCLVCCGLSGDFHPFFRTGNPQTDIFSPKG